MKIAWHMPTLQRAGCGLSRRALSISAGLRQLGHDIAFLVDARKTDINTVALDGLRVQRLVAPSILSPHWSLQAIARRRAVSALVAQINCKHDVMLTCQPEFAAAYAKCSCRAPLVFVCGGTTLLHDGADIARSSELSWPRRRLFALDRLLKHRNERTAFRIADAVVFDSHATRERVTREYQLESGRFETIHGGVDPDEFQPPTPQQRRDARRKLGIGESEDVLTWTGRLSPEKNIELLLSALACGRCRPIRELIVGEGPAREQLEKLSHQHGLGSRVSFAGMQPDVRPFLHAADVFAFPSCGESFGGALIEAMACGLPCIALRPNGETIRNANLEIIEHEKSGLLVDRAEPAALAAVIERLLGDASLRTTLGDAARRRATSLFTWPAAAAHLDNLLNDVFVSHGRPASRIGTAPRSPLQPAHA
jgi:glycosyltransferase involved in cell wall biosynthesis